MRPCHRVSTTSANENSRTRTPREGVCLVVPQASLSQPPRPSRPEPSGQMTRRLEECPRWRRYAVGIYSPRSGRLSSPSGSASHCGEQVVEVGLHAGPRWCNVEHLRREARVRLQGNRRHQAVPRLIGAGWSRSAVARCAPLDESDVRAWARGTKTFAARGREHLIQHDFSWRRVAVYLSVE